jgi:small subunit ribosomal protein S17
MSEEERTDETTDDAAEEQPPAAEEQAPTEEAADEAPAEEPEPEAPAAEGVQPDQGEADPDAPGREAEEAAGDDSAEEDQGAGDEAVAEEPEEILGPKARRKRRRARAGEARPARSPEERALERAEARARRAAARRRYRASRRRQGAPGAGTPAADRVAGTRKVRLGKVVSTSADKTITVRVEVARRHPAYEKVVRRSNTLHAHDERNEAQEGDTVRVVETRPLSRTKRWRLLEIVERAR